MSLVFYASTIFTPNGLQGVQVAATLADHDSLPRTQGQQVTVMQYFPIIKRLAQRPLASIHLPCSGSEHQGSGHDLAGVLMIRN